jgi:hypothetical protein
MAPTPDVGLRHIRRVDPISSELRRLAAQPARRLLHHRGRLADSLMVGDECRTR